MNLQLSKTCHCFWISLETLRSPAKRWTLDLPTIQDERLGSLEGEQLAPLGSKKCPPRWMRKQDTSQEKQLSSTDLNFP